MTVVNTINDPKFITLVGQFDFDISPSSKTKVWVWLTNSCNWYGVESGTDNRKTDLLYSYPNMAVMQSREIAFVC